LSAWRGPYRDKIPRIVLHWHRTEYIISTHLAATTSCCES